MAETLDDVLGEDRTQSITVDGKKIPVAVKRLSAAEIVQQIEGSLISPYTGLDEKKKGLTKGEAAFLAIAEQAQEGNRDALEMLLNRLIGKPVQQVNQFSVTATLTEFLGGLAKELEKDEPFDVDVTIDPLGD